jgi:hypothetical protein
MQYSLIIWLEEETCLQFNSLAFWLLVYFIRVHAALVGMSSFLYYKFNFTTCFCPIDHLQVCSSKSSVPEGFETELSKWMLSIQVTCQNGFCLEA